MGASIEASLTTQALTFCPGGASVTFGVGVLNRSDQFVAFELSISAAGGNHNTSWYRLYPEVSAAKPPGDRTDFQIEILESPIPSFVGTVTLTIRVFSPQLSEERRLLLRLTLEPGNELPPLRVDLPTRRFQVYPRNQIDLLVQVQNLGSRSTEVLLRLTELEPTWIVGSAERRIAIAAGQQGETTFQCQPPSASQAPSQDYPFTIAVTNREGSIATGSGIVEVLPVGFVQFEAHPQQQRIPTQGGWLPDWRSRTATFQLLLKNMSNLTQEVSIELRGKDCQRCEIQMNPVTALPLGEATPISLKVKPRRAWIGRVNVLQLEAKAWLSDQRLGSPDPATQLLSLKAFPIVPLWLLLALLALLTLLLMFLLQPPAVAHTAAVNAVRFSGTSGSVTLVLSGSDDCTIRSWTKDQTRLQPHGLLAAGSPTEACGGKARSSSGLFAMTHQAVRTLAFVPDNNQQVFAGLKSGEIQVWDVNRGKQDYTLKDKNDVAGDLFDLVFTQDSRRLYSSYGSGIVRVWGSPTAGAQFSSTPGILRLRIPDADYQIRSLALSPDETALITGGQFKRLVLWNLARSTPRLIQIGDAQRGTNDYIWSIAFVPNSSLLATADSNGYITLWDLKQCRSAPSADGNLAQNLLPEVKCDRHDRWQASKLAVRAIQITSDGRRLVSAGDDGRIVVWHLTPDYKQDQTQKEHSIATLSSSITTLDLTANDNLIVSGGADSQVRLHSLD